MLNRPALTRNVARGVVMAGVCALAAACSAAGSGPPVLASAAIGAAQAAPAAAVSDATSLVLDASASSAAYHAHEQLVGRTLPSEAVGTTHTVSGTVVIAADGSVVSEQSGISVDLSKLQSDESRRDNFIKNNTLETNSFPIATFVPRQVTGLPNPLPTDGSATFQLQGDLTVHGVTKPVTWQVTAQFADTAVTGSATTNVNISDFGMTPPRVGPVLNIEDALGLQLDFTANHQA